MFESRIPGVMSTNRVRSDAPLACVPDAIPTDMRSEPASRLRNLFESQARERTDVPDGYAWRFTPESIDEIAA